MINCNTEAMTAPKDKSTEAEPFLDERLIDFSNEKLIYVRRGSQRDSSRNIDKNNLHFDNSHLSKQHACFQYRSGNLCVKDCGSTFGTTVNDKFIVPETWHLLATSDTIGFIVSKPSTYIAKIVKKYPNDREISLEEFSSPPIGLRLSYEIVGDSQIRFRLVKEDTDSRSSSKDEAFDTNANETYGADTYYFDDCLDADKNHPKECSCAERSCTEGKEDELDCKGIESDTKLDDAHYETNKPDDFIASVEISSLDDVETGDNSNLNDNEQELEISSIHESRVAKSEDLDVESCSFGHFTSEIISGSDLDSESDLVSEFSNSDSGSSSSSSSKYSSSSSSSSSSSISGSNDSDPEHDTSVIIENIDSNEEYDNGVYCKTISETNSHGSISCGLPPALVPVLDYTEVILDTPEDLQPYIENMKKRSYEEYQSDIQNLDEEHESKKIKSSTVKDNYIFKTIVKEVAKAALYSLATIAALGIYGSTIDNQE